MLILACVPIGIFAQELSIAFDVKNDKNKNTYKDMEIAFFEGNKVVFASSEADLTYKQVAYSVKPKLVARLEDTNENDGLLSKDDVIDDSNAFLVEGMVSFSKDRKTVFFSVNRKIKNTLGKNEKEVKIKRSLNLQLLKANVTENGDWVNLEMLPFNSNNYSTGHPFLNQDDTKLYFVSDSPESMGRTDIFVVDLHEDGTYGKPINLGPKINSSEREIFPFIDKDNLLFYASDVHNKQGDLDVYVSKIFDNTLSSPLKLKRNLTIDKDAFTYEINEEKQTRKFSSSKQEAKGVEDIYASIDVSSIKMVCEQEIIGMVKNFVTQESLPNVKIVLSDNNGQQIQSLRSNEKDGSFSFKQSCNTSYTLKGYLEGYLMVEMDIKTVNDLDAAPIDIVMNMSVDLGMEADLLSDASETIDVDSPVAATAIESAQVSPSNKDAIFSKPYNFSTDQKVFTVQIGAFQGNALTDKFSEIAGLFNHVYDDGFNRYYSGVFISYTAAKNYLEQLKVAGYGDAFVVGLKGEKRF